MIFSLLLTILPLVLELLMNIEENKRPVSSDRPKSPTPSETAPILTWADIASQALQGVTSFSLTECGEDDYIDKTLNRIIPLLKPSSPMLFACHSQLNDRQKLHLEHPTDYGIRFLFTNHPQYGTGARRYLYWGAASYNQGEKERCFVFLTLLTFDKQGVAASNRWFLDAISYKFGETTLVTMTQAVAITPIGRDYIQGVLDQVQLAESRLKRLWTKMSHYINDHPELSHLLCYYHNRNSTFVSLTERDEAYYTIERALADNELCTDKRCHLLKDLRRSYHDARKEEHRFFPILPRRSSVRRKKHDQQENKCRPAEDLCEVLTGKVVSFDPKIHDLD